MISRREWTRVLVYMLCLLLLLSLPYWLAWARQGSEQVFSGFLYGVDDGNSYLGKLRLGVQGRWDFALFYTAEPHTGEHLIFLPYILPGQIIGLFMADTDPRLPAVLLGTFHLLRLVFDATLIVLLYRFIARFIDNPATRFWALIFATIGGGLGWLAFLFGGLPPEFYIPEGFSLQILLGLPHLALARTALLGALLLLMTSLEGRWWFALLAGLCWIIVGLAVPFYFVVIYAILGAWGLASWLQQRRFPWKLFWRASLSAALTVPFFLYYSLIFSRNPVFAQWSAQNILRSPAPLQYLFAYLPLGLLAIIGARQLWQQRERYTALLIGWPLLVPLLVYLPINVQRRLAEGVLIPLAILAAVGVAVLAQRWPRRRILGLTLLAILPTNLLLLGGAFFSVFTAPPQVMYPAEQIAALNWLNSQAEPGAVVYSTLETGNLVPAYTNLRAYVGHGPETLNALAKKSTAQIFFSDQLDPVEQQRIFDQVDYIFYGINEQQTAGDTLNWTRTLEEIYSAAAYTIYRVPPELKSNPAQ